MKRYVVVNGTLTLAQLAAGRLVLVSEDRAIELHDGCELSDDSFEISFHEDPRAQWRAAGVERVAFVVRLEDGTLCRLVAGDRDAWHVDELPLSDVCLAPVDQQPARHVEGKMMLDAGAPAAALELRLYHVGLGGTATLLAKTKTAADGSYAITYRPTGKLANLELRTLDKQGHELALAAPRFAATEKETLNLVVPAAKTPRAAEHQRLLAAIAEQVGHTRLLDLREDDERADISMLHAATGWDARLIGIAALAQQRSRETGIAPDALYGLLRLGAPTELAKLALSTPQSITETLEEAARTNVVALDERAIGAARTAFVKFALPARLATKAPGTVSTLGELLAPARLTEIETETFTTLQIANPRGGARLWQQAKAAGIPEAKIAALQVQGKLAFLTRNNAPLAATFADQIRTPAEVHELANLGMYEASAWTQRLDRLAEGNAERLAALIPQGFTRETYANELARQVRLAFPTQTVARMIQTDAVKLGPTHDAIKPRVGAFFDKAVPLGFALGRTPISTFVREHGEMIFGPNTAPDERASTIEAVKRAHRLYQTTPSTAALQQLSQTPIGSALEIARLPVEDFILQYKKFFNSDEPTMRQIHGKAQQIGAVTFFAATAAKQLDGAPHMFAMSAPPEAKTAAKKELIRRFPTMESLFGSLDFCECEHCRSVLGPAAYLVDLLAFLDPDATEWQGFLDAWLAKHGVAYTASGDPTQPYLKPYDALVERRPDLPNLPLTCENTNTVLPYIDIVNEILEYHVAHGKLADAAVRDTGKATAAELLAEPHNLIPEAYDILRDDPASRPNGRTVRYPRELPFDLWTTTVRAFLAHGETSLAELLDVLCPTDDLFPDPALAPADRLAYYRANVLAERLGIAGSPVNADDPSGEYAIYVDTNPQTTWHERYGYATVADAADLVRAKTLARRLGVTYAQLVDLVRTGFVNPELAALAPLRTIGIDASDVFRYKAAAGFPALSDEERVAFEARLAERSTPDLDAKDWVDTTWMTGGFERVAVLAAPAKCDFENTFLRRPGRALDLGTPGNDDDVMVLLKLDTFVRLWRRLGWTIDEVDRALQAFIPDGGAKLTSDTLGPAMRDALAAIAELAQVDKELALGKGARTRLLALWTKELATTGEHSLYAQLFLVPSVLQDDAVFAHPHGRYLESALPLEPHQPALQAALGLTADDIAAVLGSVATAVLDLPTVSKLYRHGLLARALRLSVRELRTFIDLSGIDPFAPLAPARTLAFVRAVRVVRDAGLTVAELSYLLAHMADPFGPRRRDPGALLALVDSVANAIQQVIADHAITSDSIDRDALRTTLLLVAPTDTVDAWLALLENTFLERTVVDAVAPADAPGPRAFDASPALAVRHDALRARLEVTHRGFLTTGARQLFQTLDASPALATALATIQTAGPARLAKLVEDAANESFEAAVAAVPGDRLDPFTFRTEPRIRVTYDTARQTQRLVYRGILIDDERTRLESTYPSTVLPKLLAIVQARSLALAIPLASAALALAASGLSFTASEPAVAAADLLDASTLAAWPEIEVEYDDADGVQHLRYTGVLRDATKAEIVAGRPPLLASLLDDVQHQARAFLVQLRVGVLAASDFDSVFDQLETAVLDVGARRALLARTLLPIVQARAIRQQVVQQMAAHFAIDPVTIEKLVGDASVLADPQTLDVPLLDAFAAAGERGTTADYLASTDATGPALSSRTVAAITTAGRPSGTRSVRFTAHLAVPVTGAYRFFVMLPDAGASAALRVGEPVLRVTATAANTAASEFADLIAGKRYELELEVTDLGSGDVVLEVQSDALARGSLDQLAMTPTAIVSRFERACILLAKTLRIATAATLGPSELAYFQTHGEDFDDLDLRRLPLEPDDPTAAPPVKLFVQLMRLLGYARLKRELGAETLGDDLVAVFAMARRSLSDTADPTTSVQALRDDLDAHIAAFTRRESTEVAKAARALGMDVGTPSVSGGQLRLVANAYTNERGLARLWSLLQIVERLGAPVDAVLRWATPAPDRAIAQDVRAVVKARYDADDWLAVARTIFDPLRKIQRDALAAYVMHERGLASVDQLFEYFLIDAATEPVVQTSRLRLAISSVQLFIQRCLLNLELRVPPAVLSSDQWAWMKRYRVWQANREIFLYPENWMEAELRDDKTHLYAALEGSLLQNDVTRDLAERAFYEYLRGLEQIAKLEIVSTYLEIDDHSRPIVHAVGRTPALPHKYFYRRRTDGMWTPWQPITIDIDGDHVCVAAWQQRVHVFWTTFQVAAKEPNQNATVESVRNQNLSAPVPKRVSVQLGWTALFQGDWTPVASSGFDVVPPTEVKSFDPKAHRLSVSFGARDDIFVNLAPGEPISLSNTAVTIGFHLWSTASPPESDFGELPQRVPFDGASADATRYVGGYQLTAAWDDIQYYDDGTITRVPRHEAVMYHLGRYSAVPCDNPVAHAGPDPRDASLEIGQLIAPFFVQNNRSSFFVEPTLAEETVETWDHHAPGIVALDPDRWKTLPVNPHIPPSIVPLPDPDPTAKYSLARSDDWLVGADRAIAFGPSLLGRSGRIPTEVRR